jgi:hypothetical protein
VRRCEGVVGKEGEDKVPTEADVPASARLSVRMESAEKPGQLFRVLTFPLRLLSWVATEGFSDLNGEKYFVRVFDTVANTCVIEHEWSHDQLAASDDVEMISEALATQTLSEFSESYGITVQ